MRRKPTVISLFAGCGGSSLGYRMAGYRELLAIDFWDKAIKTFRMNFPGTPAWCEDISGVTGARILRECGLERGRLDVLDASPPCQGFSTAGHRNVNDNRNDLFMQFVRLVRSLGPRVFVMENVTGMAKGRMRGRFIEIMGTLKALPYRVRCRRLNAANYGVPQRRQRLIWIGVRNDLSADPTFPRPSARGMAAGMALADVADKTPVGPMPTKALGIWLMSKPGKMKGLYGFQRQKIDPTRVAPTIGKEHTCIFYHWSEPRELSVGEYAALGSFPEDFKWPSPAIGKELIGNSVPPRMMEAIAATIRKETLSHAPTP